MSDAARQMRFTNGTTTDDHGLHIVGYYEKDGKDWCQGRLRSYGIG